MLRGSSVEIASMVNPEIEAFLKKVHMASFLFFQMTASEDLPMVEPLKQQGRILILNSQFAIFRR